MNIRYSLAVRIGLFHSLGPGSTPGIGISALQGHKSGGLFALQTAPENTHSSVVEYYTSNVVTRVRFPLGVKKVCSHFSKGCISFHTAKKNDFNESNPENCGFLQQTKIMPYYFRIQKMKRGCPSG